MLAIVGLLLAGALPSSATPLCRALPPKCPVWFGFPALTLECDNLDPIYYFYGDSLGPFCIDGALAAGNAYTFATTNASLYAYACNLPCLSFNCVKFSLYEPNPNYCGMLPPRLGKRCAFE